MKLWSVFRKTLREFGRDKVILLLTLIFAPLFVFLYAQFFPGGSTSYLVLVQNQDQGILAPDGSKWAAGEHVIKTIRDVTYTNGKPLLRVRLVADQAEIDALIKKREAIAYLILPANLSATLAAARLGEPTPAATITFGGDLTNPYYIIAATLAVTALDSYVQETSGISLPVQYVEKAAGASATRTEFETYVPGIIVFSVVMLIFLAAMTVAREVEGGTLRRLQMTPMRAFDLVGGVSVALILVGVVSLLLTFLTAIVLGFRSQGPLWVAILIGVVTSLSVIGSGMLVAAFSRTVSQAFVIANFPLGLFMFFTGIIYPIPPVKLFSLGERIISLYDLLPPTHAVAAFNKIFTLGAGLDEVIYELVSLVVLSLVYFSLGVWLFQRRHLRAN
jgi:ABC-2 type transport system permease protein